MVFAAFDELSVARRIARSQTSCIVPLVNAARVAIDPVVVERELFGRMIARWLSRDKRRDRPGRRVHGNDARAVVLSIMGVRRLIGVGREQPPPLKPRSNAISTAGPSG